MTLRDFFLKRAAVFAVLLALLGVAWLLSLLGGNAPQDAGVETADAAPIFIWSYEPTPDTDIPRTIITLNAARADGRIEAKEIDVVEGECNEYPDPDADVYADSTMIICYYAGLGRYYKVVEGEGGYLVQRKVFEEASPEYDPPIQQFETIARF